MSETEKRAEDRSEREWTLLIYMAGDNDLDANGVADLQEMKRVGSKLGIVDVIAQFDRKGSKHLTKRYHIGKSGTSGSIARDEIDEIEETDTGDPEVLKDFLSWGIKEFPAKHYLVVLWGHGTGAFDEETSARSGPSRGRSGSNFSRRKLFHPIIRDVEGLGLSLSEASPLSEADEVVVTSIGVDEETGQFLDNVELKEVFKAIRDSLGRQIDIVGMDACLMSMAEVCYQLRDSVKVMVSSEAEAPTEGWPYHGLLTLLRQNPQIDPQALAKEIVRLYMELYRDVDSRDVTQSACDLTQSAKLRAAVDELAQGLLNSMQDQAILQAVMLARARAQSYDFIESVDLKDFCCLLRQYTGNEDLQAACRRVMDVVEKGNFVLETDKHGAAVRFSHGLALYFPQAKIASQYQRLDFSQDTAWKDFLAAYTDKTLRREEPSVEEQVADALPALEEAAARATPAGG